MERLSRDFKGIWIPKEIWLSDQLSVMEKVLFAEIQSLDNEKHCYASNRYFANFFQVSERQIRTHIGALRDKGFIQVTVTNQNEREIRVLGKYARVPDSEIRRLQEDREGLIHKWKLRKTGD